MKLQASTLTEQLQAKNLEVRTLTVKQKDLQEEILRQKAQLQELHEDALNDLNGRMKEAKRAEDSRNANNLKVIARKEK